LLAVVAEPMVEIQDSALVAVVVDLELDLVLQ
jgi:hypothetical protein